MQLLMLTITVNVNRVQEEYLTMRDAVDSDCHCVIEDMATHRLPKIR